MSNVKIVDVRKVRILFERRNLKAPRINVWQMNHDPVTNRHEGAFWDKPYRDIRPMLRDALRSLGINPEGVQLIWNQKAGCTCVYSLGFIVKGYIPKPGEDYFDISVGYEYVPTETPAKA